MKTFEEVKRNRIAGQNYKTIYQPTHSVTPVQFEQLKQRVKESVGGAASVRWSTKYVGQPNRVDIRPTKRVGYRFDYEQMHKIFCILEELNLGFPHGYDYAEEDQDLHYIHTSGMNYCASLVPTNKREVLTKITKG